MPIDIDLKIYPEDVLCQRCHKNLGWIFKPTSPRVHDFVALCYECFQAVRDKLIASAITELS